MIRIAEQTGLESNQTITDQNTETTKPISNLDRVFLLGSQLLPLQDQMEKLVIIEKKYEMLLYEPRLLFNYRKEWVVFLIALKLYKNYKSGRIAASDIKNDIDRIRLYNKEFAEDIEKILPIIEKDTRIFSDLLDALGNGKEYFVSYISTHLRELIAKARSIKDARLSQQLITLFSSISGHEIEFLIKYRNDADSWSNYIISYNRYDINFFIRRVNLFLKGGFENNVQFMGLYKDFGDTQLTDAILKDNEIKNIWRFNEQLRYLNFLIGLCKKSETSGKWEGFYGKNGFWGREGDAKGKNFDRCVNEFETKYGNKDFSDILKAQKRKIGENPEGWGGVWIKSDVQDINELTRKGVLPIIIGGVVYVLAKDGVLPQLLRRLQHPSYQRQKIVLPASQALQNMFQKRENELKAKRDKFIGELIKLLQEAEGIGIAREKLIKRFERLLKKRKKFLLNQLNEDMIELNGKVFDTLLEYDRHIKELDVVFSKMDWMYIDEKTSKLLTTAKSHLMYERQHLDRRLLLRDLKDFLVANLADTLAEEALIRKAVYENFMHLSIEDFATIQKSIPRARELIRKFSNILSYIRFKVKEEYTLKVEELARLDLTWVKTTNLNYTNVEKMFNRLIGNV